MPAELQSAILAGRASDWVARRDAGLTAAQRRELQAWLAVPEHAAAFARADTARTELDWPLHAGAVDEVLEGLEQRAAQRRVRRRRLTAAGTVAAVALAAGWLWFPAMPTEPAPGPTATLVVREPQRLTLPDGSVVELKDVAQISTDFAGPERLVTLRQGTAHFQVAKNPARRFIVRAQGVTAQAVGTGFEVALGQGEVSVLVTEGRVAVGAERAPAAPGTAPTGDTTLAYLDAGHSVVVKLDETAPPVIATVPEAELDRKLAWRVPRLEFSGTPLREVVAMVNRHNAAQFVIADPALENLTLSGVLRADKVDALVDMLVADFGVAAERAGNTITLRKR